VALYLDHAFILCTPGAPEAQVLLDRGFREGSRNTHSGQGTANRRFFFSNFMLELLWVEDKSAAASELVRPTGLWERWSQRGDLSSRFGVVCAGNPERGAALPFTTDAYAPPYFPPDMRIEIARGFALIEPAVYWIPTASARRTSSDEPLDHTPPVREIVSLSIGLPLERFSPAAARLSQSDLIELTESDPEVMELRFRGERELVIDCRPQLPLRFRSATDA
jgi:hypothetical protein